MQINGDIIEKMILFRRWMHKHPELSEKETETAEKIHQILLENGIEHTCNVGGYGIVAIIRGGSPGKTVAAKADMDALPIQEQTGLDFSSQNEGVMHACGHDANTAILLGTAIALKQMERELQGNIKFFFEPAEETIGGGQMMVEEGCMEAPKVESIIGLHVMPYLDSGKVEVKKGCLNAATNEVEIFVTGVGGHAAEPEKCVDPIVVISYIISALQTFVSRNTSPTDSAVLTFGCLRSGEKGNVIPDTAYAKGTLRTLNPKQRETAKERIKTIAENIAFGFGAHAEINFIDSYDALINDGDMVDLIVKTASERWGNNAVVLKDNPSMGAEDFSYYTKNARGAYFHIGCKTPGSVNTGNLHTGSFLLDEDAIGFGIEIQTLVLLNLLGEG